MSIAKLRILEAKFQAITNASEMIRGHGEEGFAFLDKKFDKIYKRETTKLSVKLDKMAEKYNVEIEKLHKEGFFIDLEMDDDYF
jgi:hypothetical protein